LGVHRTNSAAIVGNLGQFCIQGIGLKGLSISVGVSPPPDAFAQALSVTISWSEPSIQPQT
jgi:hypothetical protein